MNLIKHILFGIADLIIILAFIMILFFVSLTAKADVAEFEIPVSVSPGSEEVILVPSYDDRRIDLERFIDLSNQTGLYPTFGWTGEYYVTGVTHGEVPENLKLGVNNSGPERLYTREAVVPEPGTLVLIGGGLGFLAFRRRRG
jgi:hypothetical protein